MENKFESICNELVALQKAKNADYGDSFSQSVKEFGLTAALIPITNKVNRLKQLINSDSAQVKDESIDDTLKDLACYAIMTLSEMENNHITVGNILSDDTSFEAKYKDVNITEQKVKYFKINNNIEKVYYSGDWDDSKLDYYIERAKIKAKYDHLRRKARLQGASPIYITALNIKESGEILNIIK